LGRQLLRAFNRPPRCEDNYPPRRYPVERWTILVRALAPLLLDLMLVPATQRARVARQCRLVLQREGPDPNRRRLLLVDRAQAGVLQADLAAA
jgi:hypothetical protein